MATDGAQAPGEEEEAVDNEWLHVQSPNPPPSLHLPPSSSSSTRWDTNDGVGVVVGRDEFLHHEGLDLLPSPPPHEPTSPPSSSPSSPPSSSSSPSPPNGTENEPPSPPLAGRLPGGVLRSGVYEIAARVRHCVLLVGGFWSFGSAAAAAAGVAAAVLLSLAYVRMQRRMWRWWRRDRVRMEASENRRLLLLIRDKDKKISQLLLQIAQMNEFMIARRQVQVLRVNG